MSIDKKMWTLKLDSVIKDVGINFGRKNKKY
jgi:hypothetical protein